MGKRVRLLNQQNTQQKSVNLHHQNSLLKQAKFWIDQVKFFMKRQCGHLYCEDAVWYEDCNKPFKAIINSVYDKVYQNYKNLQKVAKVEFADMNVCNTSIINSI